MTEKELFKALDFQKFEGNKRLQAVIDGTHARMKSRELKDDELDMVAGGTRSLPPKPEDPIK